MLRITKQTDYGIVLLALMARHGPGFVLTTRDAAATCELSLPMASKILKSLVRAEILTSQRGAGGGYSLARPAEQTSVADVVRAMEGPISMVECGAHPGACDHENSCPVRVNWARINREVERALDRVPLSEMTGVVGSSALLAIDSSGPASPGT